MGCHSITNGLGVTTGDINTDISEIGNLLFFFFFFSSSSSYKFQRCTCA